MPLSPTISIETTKDTIKVTDTTVYGGANPPRGSFNVDFQIVHIDAAGVETDLALTYNSSSVSFVETKAADGRYKIRMDISGPQTVFVVEYIFKTAALEVCRDLAKTKWLCDLCADSTNYMKLVLALEAIAGFVTNSDFVSAYKVLYGANCLCSPDDCSE